MSRGDSNFTTENFAKKTPYIPVEISDGPKHEPK